MRVCGFTIIRNAIKYDFPIKEAILSIEPLCDCIYVGVGNSEDETRALISSISPKIKIIDTIWDEALREGGKVLASETNKIFQAISNEYHWCIYIQGDEAIHEKYHTEIRYQMAKYKDEAEVDGLLFHYLHFFGNYQYTAASSKWYRNEIRIIKNNKSFFSYKDAQGFRKDNNDKLRVKAVDAFVYHYGYVKNPIVMKKKIENSNRMWHDDQWLKEHESLQAEYDFHSIDHLKPFTGSHPKIFEDRIQRCDWNFQYDTTQTKRNLKERIKFLIEHITGWRIGEYKNYILIK